MVRAQNHRRVRTVGGWRATARHARLDCGRIGCGCLFGWNAFLIHREPDQLVTSLVLRTAVAARYRLALVKTERPEERIVRADLIGA